VGLITYPETWADLVASLVNVEKWSDLSEAYGLIFEEAYERVAGEAPESGLLEWFHAEAQALALPYLCGETISMPAGVGLGLRQEVATPIPATTSQKDTARTELFKVLITSPCPLRKCRQCGVVFSVPTRRGSRQAYCSLPCRSRGIEERRPVGRRKQAAEAARKYREKKRRGA
jgi:hypothetical protein